MKRRLGIQSVEVAAAILRALTAAGRPLPLRDLARLAGMPAGKVHRYLVSLTRSELVTQDAASGHYGVGPAAVALGLAGLRNIDVMSTSTSLLPALRDEIGETVFFAMWSSQGPVVCALEESSRPVFMNIRVGSILPILQTAAGRLFAAFLPRESVSLLIEAEIKASRRRRSLGEIEKLLDTTRAQGLAHVAGDLVPGVNAIAAPLLDHKEQIAGVIGALGRSEELDVDHHGSAAQALLRVANEISRRLGALPATADQNRRTKIVR
jgi:DNA-binding IclR family transcriptional regulator